MRIAAKAHGDLVSMQRRLLLLPALIISCKGVSHDTSVDTGTPCIPTEEIPYDFID